MDHNSGKYICRNLTNASINTQKYNVGNRISILTDDIPFTKEDNCTLVVTVTLKSWTNKTNWPVKVH